MMIMEAHKVEFNIWAESEDEAVELGEALQKFVNDNGEMGIAITARKTTEAINKWRNNYLVRTQIIRYYERQV
jgi:hypothetical protein